MSQGIGGLLMNLIPAAVGTLVAYVGIPYGIATISVGKSKIDYEKKRLKIFIIFWAILMSVQIINYLHDK